MTNAGGQWSSKEFEELRKIYFAQAYEIVDELQDAMLKLEADPGDAETLKIIKRHVHTLKGDSHSIGLGSIGTLCHRMEDVLSILIGGAQHADGEPVDLLLGCVDAVHHLLAAGESGAGDGDARDAFERIGRFLEHRRAPRAGAAEQQGQGVCTEYQDLQIRTARQNGLRILEVEAVFHPLCGEKTVAALMLSQRLGSKGHIIRSVPGMESPDLCAADRIQFLVSTAHDGEVLEREAAVPGIISELRVRPYERDGGSAPAPHRVQPPAGAFGGETSASRGEMVRIEAVKVDRIMDLVGELIIGRSMIDQVTKEIEAGASASDVNARLAAVNSYLERTVSDIQKGVMKMRMVPVHQVFRKFPKMVRDLSAERGKRIRLAMQGTETELDKGIVDALSEPLAHIVRNMVDHGIEGPEERRAAGKPDEGVITLRAFHEASRIVVEACDDGRGIDTGRLRRKAAEKGLLGPGDAERLTEAEAVNLVFLSGLSTADTVTETSGRGVGMDAVKSAVEIMKGVIEIDSSPGRGVTFRLRLPLTLAVIKALLFEVAGRLYAAPVAAIAEVAKIRTDELVTVDGRRTLLLRDQVISVVSLDELFRFGGNGSGKKFALVLAAGSRKVGLLIDRLLWQQELVIKAMEGRHGRSDLVAGASILGDGKVVLILDVHAVCKKAVDDERRKTVLA